MYSSHTPILVLMGSDQGLQYWILVLFKMSGWPIYHRYIKDVLTILKKIFAVLIIYYEFYAYELHFI